MPTSLTGNKISQTYPQIIHVDGGVTGTAKALYDGDGTATVLKVSTSEVEISGNLTIAGTLTNVNTTNLQVDDSLIQLGRDNNSSDVVDIGFVGLYDAGGTDKYAGLFRDANDSGKFKLFIDSQEDLSTTNTINTSATGYTVATLVANLEAATVNIDGGNIDGTTIATSDITVGTGKTLNVSGGTLTLANDQISGDAINGGTIGSITISQLAGALDANSQAITNINIDSGAIDGTNIGANSAGTGAFTTLTASGQTFIGGTTDEGYSTLLNIEGAGGADDVVGILFKNTSASNDEEIMSLLASQGSDSVGAINIKREGNADDAYIDFLTQANGGSMTEKMRIDSFGHVKLSNNGMRITMDSDTENANGSSLQRGTLFLNRDDTATIKQLSFYKAGSEHTYFETSTDGLKIGGANVGVGVSPAKLFHVEGSTGGDFVSRIKNTDGTNGEGLQIHADNTSASHRALDVRNSGGQIFGVYNNGLSTFSGNVSIVKSNDGGDVSLTVKNSAGAGSTDETSSIQFTTTSSGHATAAVIGARQSNYNDSASRDGELKLQASENGSLGSKLILRGSEAEFFTNVGIGASPGANLDVAGGQFHLGTNGASDIYMSPDDTNEVIRFSKSAGGNLDILSNGGVIHLNVNGNVGIGTGSPQRDLVISNGGAGGMEFGAGDTASIISLFNRSNSSYTELDIEAKEVHFLTGTSPAEKMRIDSSGHVGIGTVNPRSKFHVEDATNRGVRFFSKSTTGIGANNGNPVTTTIGTFSTKYDGTGNGHACMVDAVVTARVSQSANDTSVRTVALRILIARSGNEGGGANTNSNVSIIETSNSVLAETGSAGTMNAISFSAAFTGGTNSSSSTHGVEIQATTTIDDGSGCAIDFIGLIYGHETIEFS